MEVDFKVTGLKELEDLMIRELPIKVARKSMLQGMRLSFGPMIEAARDKVVKKSHALALSIGMKTVPMRKSNFAAMVGGPMSGKPLAAAAYTRYYRKGEFGFGKEPIDRIRHGHLVEFGFKHKGGRNKKGKVTHVPAQPFMLPAFDQEYLGYVATFNKNVEDKVRAAIKKHNARSPAGRKR